MFSKHFGLKEPGFSITPDPRYLFLTHEHREALAHLLYGAGEGGGFVLLTGEVGTGKTTICRAFLEQIPREVHVALILNPALTAPELLHTICEEFGVPVPEGTNSIRVLLGRLNHYLLEAHANHHRPVLMIDEAQNLSPEVLEQIRLLTNLETHTHKLLQIFLVGQPELREILEQKGLRQLAQRITARYHLLPLSRQETRGYIRHRLAVAGVERPLFTPRAIARIHGLSGGVPRLINILCDRALLGAFATHQQMVDQRIVNKAARELQGRSRSLKPNLGPLVAVMLALLVFGVSTLLYVQRPPTPDPQSAASAVVEPPPGKPEPAIELPAVLAPQNIPASRPLAPAAAAEVSRESQIESPAALQAAEGPNAPAASDSTDMEVETEPDVPPGIQPATTALAGAIRSLEAPSAEALDGLTMEEPVAVSRLLSLWGHPFTGSADTDPCAYAETLGLRCRSGMANWYRLFTYDRPAAILLSWDAGQRQGFALVAGLDQRHAILLDGEQRIKVPLAALDTYWQGGFLLLWRPPPGGDLLIGPKSPEPYVRWLRETLGRVSGRSPDALESGVYDSALREEVRRFQQHRGLEPDGLVGPETLIQLNTVVAMPGTPRLEKP